jgi:hypothetical protein
MICEKIALGAGTAEALKRVGPLAPVLPTMWRWLEEYPEFREMYERARQMQADSHADRMLELAEEALATPSKAAAVRAAADIYKWNAEMRNPQKFSPKAAQEIRPEPKNLEQMRKEVSRLEAELGVTAQPGMVTAKQHLKADPDALERNTAPAPNLKIVGADE